MLRRLKEQVSQVANELDGRLTNNRASIASQGSQSQAHATNISQNDQEIEGFLCPMCMVELGGPDELTIHFEKEHSNTSSSQSTDQNSFPASTLATYTKEQEVEELRTRINEEKLFADKIKEELDNIKAVIAKASDVTEDEVPYMAQQIQVLTADKGMLTRQFLELEKESRQQSREMQQIKQERGDLMVKLKQMSIRMRELTDETEATKIEMEDIRRELKVATSDITRYELEVARLEKMLDQRPSEDDVNVLRTELVNAQKLMDNIAQEKDIEIKEHLNSIRNLSMEREKQHALNENLQKRIAESEETTKQLQTTLEAQADELKQRDERIIQLEDRIQGNIFELAENKNNVSRLEGKTVDAQAALEKLSSINESNEEQMIILKTKFEQSTNECKRLEAVFDEKVTVQGERLKTIGVVYYENLLVESGDYNETAKNVQFGLSIFICLCLIALFFINRHLTYNSIHRSKLTVRYQLAENVKALRTFVPFVVVDNCISILFVFSMFFLDVDFNMNLESCKTLPGYKISFAVFRTINNVLGMDIAGSNIDYFTQLKVQWLT
ncbi:hypothetical protein CAEBREN_31122 [Caenorhabditis brenneri]|uniref:C2H2-type domain-containing protein n=1 Tax=Caenorhabditis brenneri TaxID=135651 RepID=G0MSE9_CAEBE|nr:hypothetical protein CAEBREN_31122 [Caenorhabditis brenneri]